jgi:hypothetical protein
MQRADIRIGTAQNNQPTKTKTQAIPSEERRQALQLPENQESVFRHAIDIGEAETRRGYLEFLGLETEFEEYCRRNNITLNGGNIAFLTLEEKLELPVSVLEEYMSPKMQMRTVNSLEALGAEHLRDITPELLQKMTPKTREEIRDALSKVNLPVPQS